MVTILLRATALRRGTPGGWAETGGDDAKTGDDRARGAGSTRAGTTGSSGVRTAGGHRLAIEREARRHATATGRGAVYLQSGEPPRSVRQFAVARH